MEVSKHQTEILTAFDSFIQSSEFCDLKVYCCDGEIMVPGLLIAAVSPVIARYGKEIREVSEICLILPDVNCSDFKHFIKSSLCLQNQYGSIQIVSLIKKIAILLGTELEPAVTANGFTDIHLPSSNLQETAQQQYCQSNSGINIDQQSVGSFQESLTHIAGSSIRSEDDPGHLSLPGSVRTEEGYQSLTGSVRTEDQGLPEQVLEERPGQTETRQGEELEKFEDMIPDIQDAMSQQKFDNMESSTEQEVKDSELQNLCILLQDEEETVKDRRCLLNLAKTDIDIIGDEVLEDNFSDQEGRLVCLVCYKIIEQGSFEVYRSHLQEHDARQLEKVYIIMPEAGRGGPGLKKRVLSDQDIMTLYLDENGELSCKECPKKFEVSKKANFRRHIQYHTFKDKNYVYVCNECNKEFNNSSNLTRHIKLMHEEKQVFRCLHCDFEDKTRERLENHLLTVHKDKGWIYDVSLSKGLDGQELGELTEPLQNLNDDNDKNSTVFKCSGCSFRRRIRENIAVHIQQHHDGDLSLTIQKVTTKPREPRPVLKCDECPTTVSTMTQLLQHRIKSHDYQITETEAEDLKCGVCHIVCATKSGLRAHERSHQEKKFLCISCDKPYMNLYQLREHIQKGMCRDESRTCGICHKVFIDKHRMLRHLKIHENIREFKCDKCDKSFNQKRTLKEHNLTHSSSRQFECKICLKKFVQPNHLKYHLSSQHPSSCSPDQTKHKCTQCSKAFPFRYLLTRHQKVHGKINQANNSSLQCTRCSTWFSSPLLLKEHQEINECLSESDRKCLNDEESLNLVTTKIQEILEESNNESMAELVEDMTNSVAGTDHNNSECQVDHGINAVNNASEAAINHQEDVSNETAVVEMAPCYENEIVSNEMCVVVQGDNNEEIIASEITIDMNIQTHTSLDLE